MRRPAHVAGERFGVVRGTATSRSRRIPRIPGPAIGVHGPTRASSNGAETIGPRMVPSTTINGVRAGPAHSAVGGASNPTMPAQGGRGIRTLPPVVACPMVIGQLGRRMPADPLPPLESAGNPFPGFQGVVHVPRSRRSRPVGAKGQRVHVELANQDGPGLAEPGGPPWQIRGGKRKFVVDCACPDVVRMPRRPRRDLFKPTGIAVERAPR